MALEQAGTGNKSKAAASLRRFLAFVSFTWFIGEPVTEHMPYLRRCRLAMISSK